MIIELEKEHFKSLLPLNTYHNLEIATILSGDTTGRVFVDDKDQPKAGIIWTDKGLFFIGHPQNEGVKTDLDSFIQKVVKGDSKQSETSNLLICSLSPKWDELLEAFFGDNAHQCQNQAIYSIENMTIQNFSVGVGEEGIQLIPISKEVSKDHYENMGYFLVKDNTVLSRCTMDFKHNDMVSLHVTTNQDHRRKGYGELVVKATLNQCKNQGYNPYWDGIHANEASMALASRLGFHKDHTYRVFEVDLSFY